MDEDAKRKDYRKVTEEVVRFAEALLSRGLLKRDVKRGIKEEYKLSYRSIERVLARARVNLLEQTKKPREEHQSELLAVLDPIIRSDGNDLRCRLMAVDLKMKLLGLATPPIQKHEVSGPDGGPVATAQGSVVILLPDNGRDPVNTNGHNAATSAS